jgi:hypothetical protein
VPRNLRSRRRVDYRAVEERYTRYTFKHTSRRPSGRSASGCVRYSGSAPARSQFTLNQDGEPTNLPPATSWVNDIEDSLRWDIALDCIRLAYFNMTGTQHTEGLIFYPPVTEPCLLAHYQKATAMMTRPKTNTDVTEATGEIAAAYAISRNPTYAGFVMQWGLGQHAGAGIDQIWKRSDGTSITYLIVEAKGPGQILRNDVFAPPGVRLQMSKAWIVDRLARMLNGKGGQLAGEIIQRMGAKSYVPWHYSQSYLGGGKKYYAARASGQPTGTTKTVRVHAVVATAVWKKGPKLSADLTGATTYTDLL